MTKAFEAIQKIAADQKEHRKHSLCVIICWIAKITYQSITMKNVGYKGTFDVAKKADEVAQKKSNN